MSTKIITLQNMCRTCMIQFSKRKKKSNINEIPNDYYKNASIREILLFIQPQIMVEINDNLPTFMCSDCIEKLIKVHEFIEMYRNADKKFREMLNATNKVISSETGVNVSKDTLEMIVERDLTEKPFEMENGFEGQEINKYELEINEEMAKEEESDWPEFDDESLDEMSKHNSDKESLFSNPFSDNSEDEWLPERSQKQTLTTNKSIKDNTGVTTFVSENQLQENLSKNQVKAVEGLQLNVENESGSNKCKKCDKVFVNVKLWQSHMRNHLLEKRPPKQTSRQIKKKTIKQKYYECEHCKKEFTERGRYNNHILVHMEPSYLCIECGKKFKTGSSLHTHMLRHKGERNFHCQQCPMKFDCSSGLYSHMLRHSKEKQHVCDICGKAFLFRCDLKKHRLYHNGIKKFECDQCEMKFISKEKLIVHTRTHTGEKPYRCKYCDKAFAQSNDCVKHLRNHIGDDNVYQCELCPLRFPMARKLRAHLFTHKDDDEETRARNLKARLEEEQKLQIKIGIKSI